MNEKLDDIGYFLLFVYSFGGGFIGLATAAILASVGKMSIVFSILLAGMANFIGSTFLFYFSKNSKSEALTFLKKHRRKVALVHLLMKKNGSWVLFIQKFIYGIKTLVPLVAGITKYNPLKFVTINLAASFVWAISIGLAAYFSGSVILNGLKHIESKPWIAPILLVTIAGSIYLYLTNLTKKKE